MKILGLDTSYVKNFSIGFLDGEKTTEVNFINSGNTDEYITFAIDSIKRTLNFDLKEIDFYAVGIGPGSFTGLRIGVTIIKTLAWASKKKVAPISSLELLAHSIDKKLVSENTIIIPVVDAKTDKVFSAVFDHEKRLIDDIDIYPAELVKLASSFKKNVKLAIFIGDGILKYKNIFEEIDFSEKIFLTDTYVKGSAICNLAIEKIKSFPDILISPQSLEPEYLRRSEAEIRLSSV